MGELELARPLAGLAARATGPNGTFSVAAVAEAEREYEPAAAGYRRAGDRWASLGGPVAEQAYSRLGHARCLVALGRPADARASLEEARSIFARIRAAPALAETGLLLHRAGAAGVF